MDEWWDFDEDASRGLEGKAIWWEAPVGWDDEEDCEEKEMEEREPGA